jgi:uncharacterized membrane protein YedE/YeeE
MGSDTQQAAEPLLRSRGGSRESNIQVEVESGKDAHSHSHDTGHATDGRHQAGHPHRHADHVAAREALRPTGKRGLLYLLILLPFALVEGFSFERSRVLWPQVIYRQFIFQNFIVMKVFISAIGGSMVSQALMHMYDEHLFDRSRFYKHAHFGISRVTVGTFVLGCGMALAGTGSTMVPTQVGANAGNAWATVVGMFIGAIIYSLIEVPLFGKEKLHCDREQDQKTILEHYLGHFRYDIVAGSIGVVFLILIWLSELVWPNERDCANIGVPVGWYPQISGMLIGLGQVPIRAITGDGSGGSTCFMNLVATMTGGKLSHRFRIRGFPEIFQMWYNWVGLAGGALVAALAFQEESTMEGMSIWRGMLGGVFILVGSRVAGGCTCGHGISGTSELSLLSFAGAAAMFAGGIACAFTIELLF